MSVFFHSDGVNFNLVNKKIVEKWLVDCISLLQRSVGEINFVFCNDDYLLEINKKYLNHNYYTDVITFDYSIKNIISGDIFISIDRVQENAKTLELDFIQELYRVIVHGVLHLSGYNDKSEQDKIEMREKEGELLSLFG